MVQIAGLIARRIVSYAEPGDRGKKGERIGMIKFGSRVDLYLPPNYVPRWDRRSSPVKASWRYAGSLAAPCHLSNIANTSSKLRYWAHKMKHKLFQ